MLHHQGLQLAHHPFDGFHIGDLAPGIGDGDEADVNGHTAAGHHPGIDAVNILKKDVYKRQA